VFIVGRLHGAPALVREIFLLKNLYIVAGQNFDVLTNI
jgi:hypothetical protein